MIIIRSVRVWVRATNSFELFFRPVQVIDGQIKRVLNEEDEPFAHGFSTHDEAAQAAAAQLKREGRPIDQPAWL